MSWVEAKAANEARAALVVKMNELTAKAKLETRDLTTAEEAEFTAHEAAAVAHGKLVERHNRIDVIDAAVRACASRPVNDIEVRADGTVNETSAKIDGFKVSDLRKYSILRAINRKIDNKEVDGFEGEVSQELSRRSGKAAQGFYFPSEIPTGMDFERRTVLDTTQGTGGIATILDPSNWIDKLRARVVVASMGARFLTGLTGYLNLPKTTTTATAYWAADGVAPTASYEIVGTVPFSPNTMGGYVDYTRRFLLQNSTSAEAFVRGDLQKIISVEMDRVALNGSGSSNQPTGVLQQASLPITGLGTNGLALSTTNAWATVVGMEGTVAFANADGASCGYVTNSKVRSQLKQSLKSSVAGATYVWENDSQSPASNGQGGLQQGQVNGYRAMSSQNMPFNLTKASGTGLSAMIFADWSQLIVAQWGQVDILVDPYSQSSTGNTRIVGLVDMDVQVRHIEAFVAVVDIQA